MRKTFTAIALVFFSVAPLTAQPPVWWGARYNAPPDQADESRDIVVDAAGNSYITGSTFNNNGNLDITTIKYSPSGQVLWTQNYDAANDNDEGRSICLDANGNVYVVGYARANTGNDLVVVKYDNGGTYQWASFYNGAANGVDEGVAIGVDASGNVYAAGVCTENGFDTDALTVKYNSSGAQQWANVYDSGNSGNDDLRDMVVDNSGNVFVVGSADSTGLTTNTHMMTIKYNTAGVQQWMKMYNGPGNENDFGKAICLDNTGNVIVAGYTYQSGNWFDYATVKYNASGNQQWAQLYNYAANRYEEPWDIVADSLDNVYVTGQSQNTGNNSTPPDFATIKYNAAGSQQWVARYNGPNNNDDRAYSIGLDDSLNIYVGGYSMNGSSTGLDFTVVRYDNAGTQQWVINYNNNTANNGDRINAIAVWPNGDLWVTGISANSTNDDYMTIRYSYSAVGYLEFGATPGMELWPNPASTEINIRFDNTNGQFSDAVRFDIVDITGKKIKSENITTVGNGFYRIDLQGLSKGSYLIYARNKSEEIMGHSKVIIH